MKRQEFLNKIGRSFLLAVLAGGSGILLYKGKVGRNMECPDFSYCEKCEKLNNCALPEAIKFKTHGKG